MYLLETSALLRAGGTISEPVGTNAQRIIESANRKIYISIVSLWEILTLEKSEKIELEFTPDAYLKNAIVSLGCQFLHLEMSHLNVYKRLAILSYETTGFFGKSKRHTDPFDRMLIAQAIDEKLTVITKDEVFPLYQQIRTVW